MKYCVKCGNPMDDEMLFCQKCGAQYVAPANDANHPPQQDNYAEYWGLNYKDAESGNVIELTPDGVRIFHDKGVKKVRFDKTIPYTEIIDINSARATALKSGYMSIITSTEGITGNATRQQLLFDHNTVLFTKKTEPEAERIYRAIEDICSAPPASNVNTVYYENISNEQAQGDSPSLANFAKLKKRSGYLIPIVLVLVILIAVIAMSKSNESENTGSVSQSTQTEQIKEKTGEDYKSAVFDAFWKSTSDYFGIEYSDYKWAQTATSYIYDYETNGGYTAHYYLIKTAFETENIYGQKVLHEVTARCYYVPDYSNTVYSTYLTLDGNVIYYDEETECWLMNMDGGGTAPTISEKNTGITWDNFLKAYNEMAAKDPEGNGYIIDAEIDGNMLEYSFQNGETLSVETSNSNHIIRIEYIYPATGTNDKTLIMHRWWGLSSIVGAIQHELCNEGWSDAVSEKSDKILADVALAGGTDEAKANYQNGNALTSSDFENGILYTRYLDKDTELSHFIVYGG